MSPRRALIIGIDHYQLPGNDLQSAIADARAIGTLLARHEDGTPNYDCRILLDRMENGLPISRAALRKACRELFADFRGDVVFYFSGHGVLTPDGGYVVTADASEDDWGVPMQDIVNVAGTSEAHDILIILDCCHSGNIGNATLLNKQRESFPLAVVRENMTIIAASRASQPAIESNGHGRFTNALLDALDGGAADHLGWVTAPAMYAYAERRFDTWEQRPVYKSHTTTVTAVRQCAPLIERLKLRELVKHFPTPDFKFPLDPEYEPEDEHGNFHEPVNQEKFALSQLFKEYRNAGLLKASIPNEHFYWTARRSHTIELTPRGREYWMLVKGNKI